MDYNTRSIINQLAEEVVKVYDIQIPINNIENVVEKLGGYVYEDNLKSGFYEGRIRRTEKHHKFEIFIPENQYQERKKFTIAHELGHLFLHMGYEIDDELWANQLDKEYYRRGSSEEELQANEFAAALLMPKHLYKKTMDKYTENGEVNTRKIAEFFGVSELAAANRGKWLGYLVW